MALLAVRGVGEHDQLVTHREVDVLHIRVIVFIRIRDAGSQFEEELVHVQIEETRTAFTDGSENVELAHGETGLVLLVSLLAVNDCEVELLEMRVGVGHELHLLSNLSLALVAPQELLQHLDDAQTLRVCRLAPHLDGRQNLHAPSHKCLHYSLLGLQVIFRTQFEMNVDQELPGVVSGLLIFAIERDAPQTIQAYQLFKVSNLYLSSSNSEVPFIFVDQPKIGLEALRQPCGELRVVDFCAVAEDLGEQVLLLHRCEQECLDCGLFGEAIAVGHFLNSRSLFVDELQE